MLKDSRLIITNSSEGLAEVVEKMQQRVNENESMFTNRSWDECFPQRYLVVRNYAVFMKLKQILQYGSKISRDDNTQDVPEDLEELVD